MMTNDNTGIRIIELVIAYATNLPTPLYDSEARDEWLIEQLRNVSKEEIAEVMRILSEIDISEKLFGAWFLRISDVFILWAKKDPSSFYSITLPYLTIKQNDMYELLISAIQEVPPPQGGGLLDTVVDTIDMLSIGEVKDVIMALWKINDERAADHLHTIYRKYYHEITIREFIESGPIHVCDQ